MGAVVIREGTTLFYGSYIGYHPPEWHPQYLMQRYSDRSQYLLQYLLRPHVLPST